ncbi:MAG: dihydroorotase, partial [Dehalococcoidia bacterium]|nr:dihydroorotase [Dehalococcoidia bacterium]
MAKGIADLVIQGDLVLRDRIVRKGLLTIARGKVIGVQSGGRPPATKQMIDATGSLVMPGFVDAHVHTFSPPGQCFVESTSAAAAGGVTTIIDHPFDQPSGVSTATDMKKKIERIGEEALVDVALLGTVKADNLGEIVPLVEVGVCGFKMSLFHTDPVRFPRMPDSHLLQAFSMIAKTGVGAGVHAENDEIVQYLTKRHRDEGRTYPRAHCESRPPVSEVEAVLRALELAYATGVHLHVHHVSLSRCFDFIQLYREQGIEVTAETCPHYLLLSEGDMDRLKGCGKINPPLRAKSEQALLWEYLKEGFIDIVTSDDAAWPVSHKNKPSIFDNVSGAPGVQTLVPLIYSEGVGKGKISIYDLRRVLSESPAKAFGLWPQKGSLMPGSDADITIIDPKGEWMVRGEDMMEPCKWSPYSGMKLTGKIATTVVRGNVVYHQGRIVGRAGYGSFVAPTKKWKRKPLS